MNQKLQSLYELAEKENIDIDCIAFHTQSAMSIRTPDGRYHIAIDPFKLQDDTDELCKLSHELGHCQTGSFYTRESSLDLRSRHELRADKWAVHQVIPIESYRKAIADGCTSTWQLAEYFGVTEDFIRTADYIYRCEEKIS